LNPEKNRSIADRICEKCGTKTLTVEFGSNTARQVGKKFLECTTCGKYHCYEGRCQDCNRNDPEDCDTYFEAVR
jgi:hypothetical protein